MCATAKNPTESGIVYNGPCKLTGITLAAGADAAEVIVRDGGASGTILERIEAAINATASVKLTTPVEANQNLYVAITGTAPSVVIQLIAG